MKACLESVSKCFQGVSLSDDSNYFIICLLSLIYGNVCFKIAPCQKYLDKPQIYDFNHKTYQMKELCNCNRLGTLEKKFTEMKILV